MKIFSLYVSPACVVARANQSLYILSRLSDLFYCKVYQAASDALQKHQQGVQIESSPLPDSYTSLPCTQKGNLGYVTR